MQFTYASLLAIMATAAYSQSIVDEISKLPSCSVTCLTSGATSAGCSLTDYACQCGSAKNAITKSAVPCIAKACPASDIATIQSITDEICKIQAASGDSSSSAASSETMSGSAAETSGTATMTMTSGSMMETSTTSSGAMTSASASGSQAAASGTQTTAAATTTAAGTNAGNKLSSAGAVLGAAMIVALAL